MRWFGPGSPITKARTGCRKQPQGYDKWLGRKSYIMRSAGELGDDRIEDGEAAWLTERESEVMCLTRAGLKRDHPGC